MVWSGVVGKGLVEVLVGSFVSGMYVATFTTLLHYEELRAPFSAVAIY